MNYEEKYKAALGWMQGLYNGLHGKTKEEAEKFFPELKESKDEKIRKALIEMVHDTTADELLFDYCIHKEDALAWLEKQKSVGEIVERCKTSWYNEGKIDGMAEGLTDDEKYQQGWHDALEKQGEYKSQRMISAEAKEALYDKNKPFDYENATIIQKDFAPMKGCKE